jgi:hypothetical protein
VLHLRNAATLTLVEPECFLESAEQAGLRRRSTIRQQERGSRRQFFFQVHQDLLDDHRVLDAGNDPGCSCQPRRLLTSDNIELESFLTDANIDESCNRTHYGSNWLACVGKSILTFYN